MKKKTLTIDPLEREGWSAQRPERDAHELHGVVVGSHAVGAERTAAAAAMNERPLAVFAHPDGHGLHDAAVVGCAVTGRDVDVQAAQAVRAVVGVAAPGTLRCYEPSADFAGKAVAAGVGFVVACLVLLSFVFVLHWFLPKAFLRREAWRVWICRPPGQRTRSDVLVCFKQCLLNIEFAVIPAASSILRMHAAVKCAQKSGEFRLPRRKKFVILNQSTLQGGVPHETLSAHGSPAAGAAARARLHRLRQEAGARDCDDRSALR